MRKLLVLGAVAVAVFLPTASAAQLSLGARLGFGLPMGDAYEDPTTGEGSAMSDGIDSNIPLQLDVGFRITPELTLGGYLSYGFGQVPDDAFGGGVCDQSGVDCSARVTRIGIQALYSMVKVSPKFVPWLGAGIGYEWGSMKAEGGGAEVNFRLSGFEVLNLQAGGDFLVTPQFSVGPYLLFSIARYSNGEVEATGFGTQDLDFDETFHEWFSFGVRGKFDL